VFSCKKWRSSKKINNIIRIYTHSVYIWVGELKMKCMLCNGSLKKDNVKLDFWVDNELIIVEDIPADVCDQCGEKYVSAEVSKEIDNMLKNSSNAKKKIEVSVLKWGQTTPASS
jgi:YgiT-type zinc finger domain-containing protein